MKSANAAHLSSDVLGSSTTPINRVQGSSSTTRMGPFEVIDRRCPRRISAEPDHRSERLRSPLAVAHEAVALYEMQMLLSRLTPAILILLGNAVALRSNLCGRFWFHRLGMCGRGTKRDCCKSPNHNTQERRLHLHSPLTFIHAGTRPWLHSFLRWASSRRLALPRGIV